MTTGAPLYLVSACASAEEFVAAFRRYADRTGLFVPIADPLAQGRRGRIALTLKDGRILLEGDVEIVTSSVRPSPLYGRVGMTLKFVDPDAATKTALAELEKARLAMRPPPLSVVPRSSDVPAAPRPTPPPIGGRIDAANALAESVAIGDLAAWAPAAGVTATNESSSNRFVIPTIPQVGAARPKTPSVPPALQPKVAAEPKPPPVPGTPPPIALPPKVVTPPVGVPSSKAEQKMTTMGMPAIDRLPALEPEPPPVISATMTRQGIAPPPATTMGMAPIARRDPTPLPKKTETVQIPKRELHIGKQTTLGMPIVRPPADSDATSPPPASGAAAPRRAHSPSTPPAPRNPTPFAPLPIVRKPASELAADLTETTETTDITATPEPPLVGEDQRKTSLGVQMMTATPVESGWGDPDDNKPTEQQDAVEPPAEASPGSLAPSAPSRSGGLRASEIMAAMKGDDWTMTPDASSPTILPKPAEPATDPSLKAADEKSGPLPGDWAISLDPASPGGWSAPAKVEKPPDLKVPPASGNRNIAVASAKAIEAVEWEEKPTGIGEALVQIDPSLMDPAKPAPPVEDEEPINIVSSPLVDVPPPMPMPPPMPPPMHSPVAIPTPPPWAPASNLPLAAPAPTPMATAMAQPPALPPPPLGPPPRPPTSPPLGAIGNSSAVFASRPPRVDLTDGNTNFFRDSGEIPQYPTDEVDFAAQRRRKRTMLLVVIAAALAVIATVVVIVSTGGKKPKQFPTHAATGSGSGSASLAVVATGSGSGAGSAEQISSGSAHVETPAPVDAAPAAPQLCNVDVTTVPTGAELSLEDKTVLGTSPATVQLPCGVETKIYAKKAKFGSTSKAFTASADNTKLALRIAAPMFSIKVTSLPAGATITIGSRVVGITPTTVKVPAFAPTTITLSKEGFAPDTERIAPRVNNAAHHVVLKRATRRPR